MEKKQYELCREVLRRLDRTGILENFILIGSWCIPFYKKFFSGTRYPTAIRTRDIDLLIPAPSKLKKKVDVPELLKDLGFVVGFAGTEGYIRLEHPELILEFLVPEKGRGMDKPYPLPQLRMNAQALRLLNYVSAKTLKVKIDDFSVKLPHPAFFALHKLMIAPRRRNKEKASKDISAAIDILNALIRKNEEASIKKAFDHAFPKGRRKIIEVLKKTDENKILDLFT